MRGVDSHGAAMAASRSEGVRAARVAGEDEGWVVGRESRVICARRVVDLCAKDGGNARAGDAASCG